MPPILSLPPEGNSCGSALNPIHFNPVVQEIASEAADLGITLGLEVINRYETNVLNTAVQASCCPHTRMYGMGI